MTDNMLSKQVFIGGCSRSGTTLIGAMIGAHSDCICTPESHFKIENLRAIKKGNVEDNPASLLEQTKRHWRFKIWELELDSIEAIVRETQPSYAELLNLIVAQYGQQQGKPQAKVWVDHTPENLGYVSSLLEIYPTAKMIHIVRDGRAVAASILPLDWGPNTIFRAAQWWMRMTSYGLAAEITFGPKYVLRVNYDDLVLAPEKTMRAISAFVGIPYQTAMLEATGFNPPVYTSSQHKLVGSRLNPDVVSRWKNKLSARQVEIFEYLTRDFLAYLDYPLEYGLKANAPSFTEIQLEKIKELLRGEIINRFRWLKRSYPLWLSRDFYTQARLTDINNK